MAKVTLTWTTREYHRQEFDLSTEKGRIGLASLLGLDEGAEHSAEACIAGAEQTEEEPDTDVQERLFEFAGPHNFFDVDTGDCVRLTDVKVDRG